ncbi:MAG TPA: glycosyltransferase [Burkholderiales bacterium]|nr:glycosyltransferase [Burkholderiales bacterium]
MKVLLAIPGHLKTVPMGRFTAEALQELGHDVVLFDYHAGALDKIVDRVKRSDEEKASVNRRLRRVLESVCPDLFVTLFGFDISVESLAHMRRLGIPTACWWINDPFQYERSVKKAPHYDFVFSNSEVSAAQYRTLGVANAYFLPTACVPAVHRSVPLQERYRCDVCFAGDWSPLREQLMERLVGRFDLKIFGPWGSKMKPDSQLRAHLVDGFFSPADMAAMFSSARVVVNIHTWFGKFDHGLNPRLFEAAGCASFQVVDWKQEIPKLFDCPSEMACYRSLDEVPELIAGALSAPDATRATAAATQRRAYRDHTYKNRMQTLIDLVGKAGA